METESRAVEVREAEEDRKAGGFRSFFDHFSGFQRREYGSDSGHAPAILADGQVVRRECLVLSFPRKRVSKAAGDKR